MRAPDKDLVGILDQERWDLDAMPEQLVVKEERDSGPEPVSVLWAAILWEDVRDSSRSRQERVLHPLPIHLDILGLHHLFQAVAAVICIRVLVFGEGIPYKKSYFQDTEERVVADRRHTAFLYTGFCHSHNNKV